MLLMHRRAEKRWWDEAACALGHFISDSDNALGVVAAI